MNELNTVFSDFQKRIQEIANHAEDVQYLDFKARLKNGTAFEFHYDMDSFAKQTQPKKAYRPASIFNAIVDILGGLISIGLLVYLLIIAQQPLPASAVLTYCFFIAYFSVSTFYHFFDKSSRANPVFYNLSQTMKILGLGMANIGIATINNSTNLNPVLFPSLILSALCLLLLSGGTKASLSASMSFAILLPFIALLNRFTFDCFATATLFGLWSFGNLVAKPELRIKSNSIFALVGLLSLTVQFTQLVVI